MADLPEWKRVSAEQDQLAEQRLAQLTARGVRPSPLKGLFVPAEDWDSNPEIVCPLCRRPRVYGLTRRVEVCLSCDWIHFIEDSRSR